MGLGKRAFSGEQSIALASKGRDVVDDATGAKNAFLHHGTELAADIRNAEVADIDTTKQYLAFACGWVYLPRLGKLGSKAEWELACPEAVAGQDP